MTQPTTQAPGPGRADSPEPRAVAESQHPDETIQTDILIVGRGAAALNLAERIGRRWDSSRPKPRVLIVGPTAGPDRPDARTWCYFEPGEGVWDAELTASWSTTRIIAPDGGNIVTELARFGYKMLRSDIAEAAVLARLDDSVTVLDGRVTEVRDGPKDATVLAMISAGTSDAGTEGPRPVRIHATTVFDTRPTAPPASRAYVLKSLLGWFIETETDAFDPADGALLMDYRVPQPEQGLAVGSVLPLSPRTALIEYTEFAKRPLDLPRYEAALDHYLRDTLGVDEYRVTQTERGVIPMVTGRFRRRLGRRVFALGAAAGATRPLSGYTFNGIQNQVDAVVEALERGGEPMPPLPYARRHRVMDAVLLRVLQSDAIDGPVFTSTLFRRLGARTMLSFLDGRSGSALEGRILRNAPLLPFIRAAVELPFLSRRPVDRS